MKDFPISVVTLGPDSQVFEEDEPLDFIEMPRGMHTYNPPRIPEAGDPQALLEAVRVLRDLVARMQAWTFGTPGHPVLHLDTLSPGACLLINEALGQGEVSAVVNGEHTLKIQETVFAGVWRVRYLDSAGQLLADCIEACAVPKAIAAHALAAARSALEVPALPDGVMNAPVLLSEIRDVVSRYAPGDAAHVINLTLLPLTPQDFDCLLQTLGAGCSVVLSRGYGNCRVSSTTLANTWWVQYYNSGESLILNTIEITDMPDVVLASADDYTDSLARLIDWIDVLETD